MNLIIFLGSLGFDVSRVHIILFAFVRVAFSCKGFLEVIYFLIICFFEFFFFPCLFVCCLFYL